MNGVEKAFGGAAESIITVVVFFIPGYVWQRVFAAFVPRASQTERAWLMEALAASCVVHGVSGGVIYLAVLQGWPLHHSFRFAGVCAGILFVLPAVLGFLSAMASLREWPRHVAEWVSGGALRPIHPIPEAWDYQFSKTLPVWVRVHLRDESVIGGFFGERSLASSNPERRDLFVERVFLLDENRVFKDPVAGSRGMWIRGEDIKLVEFLAADWVNYEQEDKR